MILLIQNEKAAWKKKQEWYHQEGDILCSWFSPCHKETDYQLSINKPNCEYQNLGVRRKHPGPQGHSRTALSGWEGELCCTHCPCSGWHSTHGEGPAGPMVLSIGSWAHGGHPAFPALQGTSQVAHFPTGSLGNLPGCTPEGQNETKKAVGITATSTQILADLFLLEGICELKASHWLPPCTQCLRSCLLRSSAWFRSPASRSSRY